MTRCAGGRVRGRRLRGRAPPASRAARTSRRPRSRRTSTASWPRSARQWPSVQDAGHQPHPLHRLERLGDRSRRSSGPRHPLRHELLLQRPAGLADAARPADRLRLPAALRRPRRLDDRRLPGDDAGHRRVRRDADDDADAHAARQRARLEGLLRRVHRRSCTPTTATTSSANDIVSEAQDRGVPVVSSAQMLDWLDGRNGSSFGTSAYSGGHLTFSSSRNPKARGLEAMLPAQLGLRPAVGPDARRPARVVDARARSRASTTSSSRPPPATTPRPTRPTRRAGRSPASTRRADAEGHATVTWRTDEPSTSRVDYGRTADARLRGSRDTRRGHRPQHRAHRPEPGHDLLATASPRPTPRATARPRPATPRRSPTPPGALVDSRTDRVRRPARRATPTRAATLRRHRRRGAAAADGRRGVRGLGAARPAGRRTRGTRRRRRSPRGGALCVGRRRDYTDDLLRRLRARSSSRATSGLSTTRAWASATTSATTRSRRSRTGDSAGAVPACTRRAAPTRGPAVSHRCPASSLNVPHRFRIVWNADQRRVLRRRRARRHAHRRRSTADAAGGQRLRPVRRRRCRCTGCAWATTRRPARSRSRSSTADPARPSGAR